MIELRKQYPVNSNRLIVISMGMTTYEIVMIIYFGILTLMTCILVIKIIWGDCSTGMPTFKNPPPPPPPKRKRKKTVYNDYSPEKTKGVYQPTIDNTKEPPKGRTLRNLDS